jgi:hypothetical protein
MRLPTKHALEGRAIPGKQCALKGRLVRELPGRCVGGAQGLLVSS